jgi:Gpi18-like mannosyltransferase
MEERYCNSNMISIDERLLPLLQNGTRVFPGDLNNLSWCQPNRSISLLTPAYYSTIQQKYWDVGFLSYWQFKKLFMFLLASPTLGFVLYGAADLLFGEFGFIEMLLQVFF